MSTIAIIGGGAAGLMAAITAAEAGAEVTVYEQNGEPGKKILASGNGRCNIINRATGIEDYEGEAPAFAATALEAMNFTAFERFCKRIGLLLEVKEDGKCYPMSQEARSVQSALIRAAQHRGVRFENNATVTRIEKEGNMFTLSVREETRRYERLIIATGSPAAPQLGGNESGMTMAEHFGHRIVPPFPSLVGLHLEASGLEKMAGTKTTARVTLFVDNQPLQEEEGDLLFTRYGVSGFAVLDLSHAVSRALRDFEYVTLKVDLLPRFTAQSLAAQLEQMAKLIPDDTLADLLGGLLPRKLIRPLLLAQKLSAEQRCGELNAKTAKKIAYIIKQWPFTVSGTHGYQHAEVAGGGVATEEIDPGTMASRKAEGLYFAGEVIDITGHRGGFNFHFAWGSGYLAGLHAARTSRA
ncbi:MULTISPECIES: NAD(P)/FAD-dependent oxidoreductase [Sulfurimonas]|uniref:NAD(P)/FAD-dependent oxidoreductase n=1 Tax=Sulfurimonas diazotrophicus TaxID=3131939 RepID=A0ABZ3HEE9_9BACT